MISPPLTPAFSSEQPTLPHSCCRAEHGPAHTAGPVCPGGLSTAPFAHTAGPVCPGGLSTALFAPPGSARPGLPPSAQAAAGPAMAGGARGAAPSASSFPPWEWRPGASTGTFPSPQPLCLMDLSAIKHSLPDGGERTRALSETPPGENLAAAATAGSEAPQSGPGRELTLSQPGPSSQPGPCPPRAASPSEGAAKRIPSHPGPFPFPFPFPAVSRSGGAGTALPRPLPRAAISPRSFRVL